MFANLTRDERLAAMEARAAKHAYGATSVVLIAAGFVFMFLLDDTRAAMVLLGSYLAGAIVYLVSLGRRGVLETERDETNTDLDRRRIALTRLGVLAVLITVIHFAIRHVIGGDTIETSLRSAIAATTGGVIVVYYFLLRRSRSADS